ncbi:MAG: DNRLRE domain-containing protein, partial [Planctomycetota bacterium]
NQTATTFDTGTMSNGTTYYWRIDEINAGGTTTGTVWSFATIVAAPGQASSPSPSNSATGVSITTDLSWTAGSGATSRDVYFGTSSPGASQGNQTATTFDTGTMSNNTTYYWRIDEINAGGTTTGTVWSFTTIVAAPGQASSPSPSNSATDVGITADLSWTAGSGATSRDVYFGTSSPGTSQGNQTATTFDTGTMSNDTTYYWRIDEINAGGTTTGMVWSFTTIVAAPGAASSPSPTNTVTDVAITADLSWSAGSGATSRDVYFGTSSPGTSQGNQTATTFDTGTMSNNTTYYWRIDEINAGGTTTGTVWSFTTEQQVTPDANLVGWWRFENNADDSAGTNDGTIYGAVSATGKIGQALSFDEVNDYVTVPDFDYTNASDEFSLSFWFKISDVSGSLYQYMYSHGNITEDNSLAVYFSEADEGTGGEELRTWITLGDSTDWYSVSDPDPNIKGASMNPTSSIYIGARNDLNVDRYYGNSSTNDGLLDDVRLYDRALSQGDISSLFTGGITMAHSPSPADTAADVSITPELSWTPGDYADTHDVYLGTDANAVADANNSSDEFMDNVDVNNYDPNTLDYSTTYYWAIDEVNDTTIWPGDVWSFTTEQQQPPAQATTPSPANSATDVNVTTDLSWTAGSGATSHDVYFGTTSPGTSQGNQTATTFDTGTMANDTTYYWRIDEVNAAGTTTGTVWSFTTVAASGPVTEEFGDAADTNYPGTIADTYNNSGYGGDDNWSTDTTLNTYTWPADTIANTTIIKWDLTDIPTDANVTEATLYLYQVESSGDSSYDIGVHKITGVDPNITACTWQTYDGTNSWTGGSDGGQSDIAAAEDTPSVNLTDDQYKTWDVTDMVADWVATPANNYGMLVNSDGDASVDSYRFFASTEDNDSSTRPKLIVTYSD